MWTQARPLAAVVTVWLVTSLAVGGVMSWWDRPASAQSEAPASGDGSRLDGETLWNRDCASCHGVTGDGTKWAPSLHDKGPAGVALTVETGRMPIERLAPFGQGRIDPEVMDEMTAADEPSYSPRQIDALVEYTRGFLGGPDVRQVDIADVDLSRGKEQFQLNCAACHGWSGRGGALTSGDVAPSLTDSTPSQVVQAMRVGLGIMPVFNEAAINDQEAAAIAGYVQVLQSPRTGGLTGLGYRGPVPEGAVAWFVGLLAIVLAVRWIGAAS